jgi:hypothetical protein
MSNPLHVKMGDSPGTSFHVRSPVPIVEGVIPTWKRVVIRTTGKVTFDEKPPEKRVRAWVIVPGTEENEIEHRGFYVRGRFDIVEQENNPRLATELWRTTQAE